MKIEINYLDDVKSSVKAFKKSLKESEISKFDIKEILRNVDARIIDSSCIRSRLLTIKEDTEQKQEEIYKTIIEINLKIEILKAYKEVLNDYLIKKFSGYAP